MVSSPVAPLGSDHTVTEACLNRYHVLPTGHLHGQFEERVPALGFSGEAEPRAKVSPDFPLPPGRVLPCSPHTWSGGGCAGGGHSAGRARGGQPCLQWCCLGRTHVWTRAHECARTAHPLAAAGLRPLASGYTALKCRLTPVQCRQGLGAAPHPPCWGRGRVSCPVSCPVEPSSTPALHPAHLMDKD